MKTQQVKVKPDTFLSVLTGYFKTAKAFHVYPTLQPTWRWSLKCFFLTLYSDLAAVIAWAAVENLINFEQKSEIEEEEADLVFVI